jgi:hypothetical protein
MEKSESIKELTKAIIKVMVSVKNIDKSMTVGSGSNSYKGVADKDVKHIIGGAMAENGLALIPIDIASTVDIANWDEAYNGASKRKQSVTTQVTTTYLLTHESGEFITVKGYGHGVDSQDKSAGKATTYALKYLLLYLFLTPTGHIDDSDKENSNDIEVPKKQQPIKQSTPIVEQKPKATEAQIKSIQDKIRANLDQKVLLIEGYKNYFDLTSQQLFEISSVNAE